MTPEALVQDVRIGFRMLAKERLVAGLAVLVLAVGISAVTTQFSLVNAVMLRGFSFPTASRLVDVTFIDPSSATVFGVNQQLFSMDFEEFAPEQRSFERVAAYLSGSTVNMTIDGKPRRFTGVYTTPDFLRILGVAPTLGRDFTPADNGRGAERVAIIGYGLWQREFGGARGVVGKGVQVNGKPTTIVGVMPQGFVFPGREEVWLPLYSDFPVRPRNDPQANSPAVIGLLRKDATLESAGAEFNGFARRFAAAYPDTNKAFNAARVQPLLNAFSDPVLRGTLYTMLAFCAGLLLIACVNVMNMQFARATLRARELAVRSALGATRIRLIRQMLTESVILAGLGAALGIGLAYWSVDWLDATLRTMENGPPAWMVVTIDRGVLLFTVAAAAFAALASGLLPAWMAARENVVTVLREGGRGTSSRAVKLATRGLVVAQIVVTCVLLIGSLLQARSIVNQQRIDFGYPTDGILTARMGLMEGEYPTPQARRLFYERLLGQLRGQPEFQAAALTSRMRMVFSGSVPVEIEGRTYRERRDRPNANLEQVSPGYFRVLGQRLLDGRLFNDDDLDSKLPVAIVNAAFAEKHFGRGSAVGRRFRTGDGSGEYGPWRTIVGVVSTVRMLGPFNNPNVDETGYYVPFYSQPFGPAPPEPVANQFATVIVKPRPGVPADSLVNALRREVTKVDPNLPLYFVGTPKAHVDASLAGFRVISSMFTLFGGVAMLLAAVGIYGVVAFAVSQQTQEFGVRMALGADTRRILRQVLTDGGRPLAIGLLVGVALSLALGALGGEAVGTMLFGVSPTDPIAYGSVVALVIVVSLAAMLVPARRATRVEPMITLRAE
ncbi:MAG: permease [Acidobacteria bacterium]|nr:permease [Acidobacteriota bacterium]